MKYQVVNATKKDLCKLIEYKLDTIYKYVKNITQEEINRINDYVETSITKQLNNYKIIKINKDIIGCFLIVKKDDKLLLDEIYIESKYRNKKIGSTIINKILNDNQNIYLWVYKDNIKAWSLYKRFGFSIIEETENRYFMQYNSKKV